MKNNFFFLGIILLASCGKIETANKLNIVRKFEPLQMSNDDKNTISGLCAALGQKAAALDSALGSTFVLSLATKDCNQASIGSAGDVTVTAQREGSDYLFKVGTAAFRFQYIETNNSGIMKEICNGISGLTNPFKASNGNAVWISTNATSGDCPSINGNKCILIESGMPQANTTDSFSITVRDWLRIVTDQNLANYGFYSYRKQINKSFCTEGRFQEAIATLK
jgi:hypothetical protein